MLYGLILYYIKFVFYLILLYDIVFYIISYSILLYYIISHYFMFYYSKFCIIFYFIVLYCIILYYIIFVSYVIPFIYFVYYLFCLLLNIISYGNISFLISYIILCFIVLYDVLFLIYTLFIIVGIFHFVQEITSPHSQLSLLGSATSPTCNCEKTCSCNVNGRSKRALASSDGLGDVGTIQGRSGFPADHTETLTRTRPSDALGEIV